MIRAHPLRVLLPFLAVAAAAAAWGFLRTPPTMQPTESPPRHEATPAEEPGVVFDPPTLSMGHVDPLLNTDVQLVLRNNSGQPITLERVVSDCTCAVPSWDSEPIAAGETTVITVAIDTGKKQGVRWTKRITALVAGQDPVNAVIEAEVNEYVQIEPATVDAPADDALQTETTLKITSTDGQPFTVIGSTPDMVVADSSAAPRHTVRVDWAKWHAADRPRNIEIVTSHPKSPPLAVTVRRK